MVALRLENFGGMIPAVDDRLLPESHAALAENTWLYSGRIRGFHLPVEVFECVNPNTKKVYRIPIQYYDKEHITDSYWMEFDVADTDVIRSPTVNDTFDRYYWVQSQDISQVPPKYNTRARIAAGDPAYTLGIPAPTTAMTISGVTGGAPPTETRAYVYTWVSAYGEESAPSPPVTFTGNADGTWNISVIPAIGSVATDRNITHINIYRTITSSLGTATYYFVDQLDIADTSYADAVPTTTVALALVLKSIYWTPPPEDLEGIVSMPNGMAAGWRGNEVWFCEPYRPHAWPVSYAVTVEYPIVGMGVIGQSLIVLTTGQPYAVSGTNPSVMAISRMAQFEPCLSRGSIISTPIGVAYASSNGLAIALPGSVTIVSRNMVGKDKWQELLSLPTLRAVPLNGGYYCWGSVRAGCFESTAFEETAFLQDDFSGAFSGGFIDINSDRVAFNSLTYEPEPTDNVIIDHWTGEVFLLRDGKVYWLDISNVRSSEPFIWRSKRFTMPYLKNLGAMRTWFDIPTDAPTLNPVPNASLEQDLAADQYGLVRIYADGRHVYTRELRTTGEVFRLPAGFKAEYYQVEIEARVEVSRIELASSVKELQTV